MKNVVILLAVFCILKLTSCTCSSGCSTIQAISVKFEDYDVSELDSILLERFVRGSQFSNRHDERYLSVNPSANSNDLFVSFGLREDFDYRITVLSNNNQIDITEIEDPQKDKGRGLCLFYTKEALECPLESMNVTGSKVSRVDNTSLVLTK